MVEFQPGHYGDTKPLSEAFDEAQQALEQGEKVTAVHVGTPEELEAKRLEKRLLEERVSEIIAANKAANKDRHPGSDKLPVNPKKIRHALRMEGKR